MKTENKKCDYEHIPDIKPAKDKVECLWSQDTCEDVDDQNWNTGCGDRFYLTSNTPSEHGINFCCFCGKPIKEKLYQE